MTSAISASNRPTCRRGFSLVEILVVIGIIIVLVGILLPAVLHAYRAASVGKAGADMQAIGAGLEAYKADFGDYPRNLPTNPVTQDDGAFTLCMALLGPGNVADNAANYGAYSSATTYYGGTIVSNGGAIYMAVGNDFSGKAPPTSGYWLLLPNGLVDGADGLGFRTRNMGTAVNPIGKVWGPYLQADKFKVSGGMIVDSNNAPYAYYPTSLSKPSNIYGPAPTAATGGGYAWVAYANKPLPLYNANNNIGLIDQQTLCCLLDDYSTTGCINSSWGAETAIGSYPYLLISAGPDGAFGVPSGIGTLVTGNSTANWAKNKQYMNSCDDVTNFTR